MRNLKKLLSLLVALCLLCGALPVADAAEDSYTTRVEAAIERTSSLSASFVKSGLLYDMDGNGVEELLLLYAFPAGYNKAEKCVYSLYTKVDGQVRAIKQEETLYTLADNGRGLVGVVKDGGKPYFVTYRENSAQTEEGSSSAGDWKFYAVSAAGLTLTSTAQYRYQMDPEGLTLSESAEKNGESLTLEQYTGWQAGLENVAVLPGEDGDDLYGLLEKVKALEEDKPVDTGVYEEAEPNDSFDSAQAVASTCTVTGSFSSPVDKDYYQFLLPDSGRLVMERSGETGYRTALYGEDRATVLWEDPLLGTLHNGQQNQWDLKAGIYTLCFSPMVEGSYGFKLTFVPSGATDHEPNDCLEQADLAVFDQETRGHLALNDASDFYRFTAEDSSWSMEFTTYMPRASVFTYDSTGKLLSERAADWNAATGVGTNVFKYRNYTVGKTYYIEVRRYTESATGPYSFTMSLSPVATFDDVPADAYYKKAVDWAVRSKVTAGTSERLFSPDDPCTRAQAVAFLWRSVGCPEPENWENPFTDVAEGQYYYKAVLWAVENGVVYGTSSDAFSPDQTCSRAQIAAFLYRLEGSPEVLSENPFTDVAEADYFADAVRWGAENGVIYGTDPGLFSPNATCTRAQIVTFLYRSRA